jgi:hypothetical protein
MGFEATTEVNKVKKCIIIVIGRTTIPHMDWRYKLRMSFTTQYDKGHAISGV